MRRFKIETQDDTFEGVEFSNGLVSGCWLSATVAVGGWWWHNLEDLLSALASGSVISWVDEPTVNMTVPIRELSDVTEALRGLERMARGIKDFVTKADKALGRTPNEDV